MCVCVGRVTAWTLKMILAAQLEDWENLVYVEPRLVTDTIDFLLKHQAADGSFHETHHYDNTTLTYTMSFKVTWEEKGREGKRKERERKGKGIRE